MYIKWELDVPAMVAKLGPEKAKQLWEQSKNKKDVKGRGFRVRALSQKMDNLPFKSRKVRGVTKVEVDENGKVDRNALNPEIAPFIKVDRMQEMEEGKEEEMEESVDAREFDKDIDDIDKAIASYKKGGQE